MLRDGYTLRPSMSRVAVVLLMGLVIAGCSPTTKATVSRGEVIEIDAESVPESPVLRFTPQNPHWAAALSRLPAQLPAAHPRRTCATGPVLILRLRGGAELDYVCKLPDAIAATRNYITSLGCG